MFEAKQSSLQGRGVGGWRIIKMSSRIVCCPHNFHNILTVGQDMLNTMQQVPIPSVSCDLVLSDSSNHDRY